MLTIKINKHLSVNVTPEHIMTAFMDQMYKVDYISKDEPFKNFGERYIVDKILGKIYIDVDKNMLTIIDYDKQAHQFKLVCFAES